MKKYHLLLVAVLTATTACATLSKEGRNVRMFRGSPGSSCELLGAAEGSYSWGWTPEGDAEGAMEEFLNNAAKLGGNWVRVTNHNSNIAECRISGAVYRCGISSEMELDYRSYGADPEVVERHYRAMAGAAAAMSAASGELGNALRNYNTRQTTVLPNYRVRDPEPNDSYTRSPATTPSYGGGGGANTCGLRPLPNIGCRIGRCVDGSWEQVCDRNSGLVCGLKPLPNIGCRIGRCVDGSWEQVCDSNSGLVCGLKPLPNIGCRIGRCVDGQWEQVCN